MRADKANMLAAALVAVLGLGGLGVAAQAVAARPAVQVQRLPNMRIAPVAPAAVTETTLARVREFDAGKLTLRDLTPDDPLKLDLRNLNVPDRARLAFHYPAFVVASRNEVQFESLPGDLPSRLKLEFNAPSAGLYLVTVVLDCGVDHGGGLTPKLVFENLGSPAQTYDMKPGAQRRSFLLESPTPGWSLVLVSVKNAGWTFRGIEIAKIGS